MTDLTDRVSDDAAEGAIDDLSGLAHQTASEANTYLRAVTEVAAGSATESALPVLLLALSEILVTGARLGAIQDVVPEERFEADTPDVDLEPLRDSLANLFMGIDEYVCVADPIVSGEVVPGSLTDDLCSVAEALSHGLWHYRAGRVAEALWWWQFSYLSSWGDQATLGMRTLRSILSHVRLDADDELVGEAEFDALHP